MLRSARPRPVLSPATAKHLVEAFSHDPPSSCSSDSPRSPDSQYSDGSPPLPDPYQSFEFDPHTDAVVHDEEDYESLMAESEGWDTPAWGRWPETTGSGPGWSPTALSGEFGGMTGRRESGSATGSIISLSGRRSFSGASGRKPSSTLGKALDGPERRDSDPSLLGFDLINQRRRSSARSASSRRRSSAFSITSIDPSEDARLRAMASMDALGRRFSEVVEVTLTPHSDSSSDRDDVAVARGAVSAWSPWTASTYSDADSELHTAPYFPTPELAPGIPVVFSNFPLASSASEARGTPSDISMSPSPLFLSHRLPTTRPSSAETRSVSADTSISVLTTGVATPPAPMEPFAMLRAKSRPVPVRASTNYEFPPRSNGVPAGAAPPRPTFFARSISAPFISSAPSARAASAQLEMRAAGSFPVFRQTPLGISPLRESIRRQSVATDGTVSTHPSPSLSEGMSPATSRRPSAVDVSPLPSRRASRDTQRNKPIDLRRASLTGIGLGPSRKSSVASIAASRKSSVVSNAPSRKSSVASQGLADRRPSSQASRKSSIVSISEYGYLAPEIVIDAPDLVEAKIIAAESPAVPRRLRSNAPPSIILPPYSFPSPGSAATPTPSLATPRYNPLDSFFGRSTTPVAHFTPTTPMEFLEPLSPISSGSGPGSAAGSMVDKTPTLGYQVPRSPMSIMDRGRPVSPPEFRDYSIPLAVARSLASPRTVSTSSAAAFSMAPPSPGVSSFEDSTSVFSAAGVEIVHLRPSVARKVVPQLSSPELRVASMLEQQRRQSNLDAGPNAASSTNALIESTNTESTETDQAAALGESAWNRRRAISIHQDPVGFPESRPPNRRQTTLPPQLDQMKANFKRRSQVTFKDISLPIPIPQSPIEAAGPLEAASMASGESKDKDRKGKSVLKRSSVIFAEPTRPGMNRASSFSRFFQSKSKLGQVQAQRSGLGEGSTRPLSMDSSAEAAAAAGGERERTLMEMKEVFRKIGANPRD